MPVSGTARTYLPQNPAYFGHLPYYFLTCLVKKNLDFPDKAVFPLTRENPTSPYLLWVKTALKHACIKYTFTHVHPLVPWDGRPAF